MSIDNRQMSNSMAYQCQMSWNVMTCQMSNVICQIPNVKCQIPNVKCQIPNVKCIMYKAKSVDLLRSQ